MFNLFFSYHPFYITDSSEGGFGQKTMEEQKQERVFAGVAYDKFGSPHPTAGKSMHLVYFLIHSVCIEMCNLPNTTWIVHTRRSN